MTDEPRGPGRPRRLAVPLGQAVSAIQADEPIVPSTEPTSRRRRASVGGLKMKLSAPARAGFVRRWFNDDGNRIADAQELAYDFVHEGGIQTSSPGSRVSRLVGTKANGEPLHAYLMETPQEEHSLGVADKEAHNRQIDEAIVAGRDSTGQLPSSETYGQGSIKSDR